MSRMQSGRVPLRPCSPWPWQRHAITKPAYDHNPPIAARFQPPNPVFIAIFRSDDLIAGISLHRDAQTWQPSNTPMTYESTGFSVLSGRAAPQHHNVYLPDPGTCATKVA